MSRFHGEISPANVHARAMELRLTAEWHGTHIVLKDPLGTRMETIRFTASKGTISPADFWKFFEEQAARLRVKEPDAIEKMPETSAILKAREAVRLALYRRDGEALAEAVDELVLLRIAQAIEAVADRVEQALGARP